MEEKGAGSGGSAQFEHAQSKRPEDSDFKQQRLAAWSPLLVPSYVISTFLLIGVLFIPIGTVIILESNDVVQIEVRYDDICTQGQACNVTATVTEDMSAPIFFYYKLSNFYQNHRRYVKSRSDEQLRGDLGGATDLCTPLESNANGTIIVPCGLIANSFFNDSFSVERCSGGSCGTLAGNDWLNTGIAWQSDIDDKFKYADPFAAGQTNVADDGRTLPRVDNEAFIVWMRTAGLPTFKKLSHRITGNGFSKGDTLRVEIANNYPVADFDGKKYIVFSTTSWLGGKNTFLGWAYVIVGAICILLALGFFLKHRVSPRKLGDMTYFHWSGAAKGSDQ